MFYQTFLLAQMKRIMIISNRHGTYELPKKLLNNLDSQPLKIILGRSETLLNYSLMLILPQNEEFANTSKQC